MTLTTTTLIGRFTKDFDALPDATKELYLKNALKLTARVSELLSAYGKDLTVTSGWRPKSYNLQIGGSTNSHHCTCLAIDLWDPDKAFGLWCMANLNRLKEIGLYMEALTTTHKSPEKEKRWVHLQAIAPKSGSTVFNP